MRSDRGTEISDILCSEMLHEIRQEVEKGDTLNPHGSKIAVCYLSEMLLEKSCYE